MEKLWDDNGSASRPGSVTVQLYKDGKAYEEPVELNDGNEWKYTWTGLENGHTWTVEEVVKDGYTATYTDNENNNWTITNSRGAVIPSSGNKGLAAVCGSAAILAVVGLILGHKKKKRKQ